MMILTTVAQKQTDYLARVYWRVGVDRSGIIDVTLDFAHKESDLFAELVAIRYLLVQGRVFDRQPTSGKGYKLVVSKGAIKKLALGRSSKTFANKYAAFLSGRMRGVTIETSKNMEYMADEQCAVENIDASGGIYARTFEEIDTPSMGKVMITQHAIDQYTKRISTGVPNNPFSSLISRLQHPKLKLIPLSEKVLEQKKLKYGNSNAVEAYGHDSSDFIFMVIISDQQRILVTAFERAK